MTTVRIAPLVEGDGEVAALPVLLRRLVRHIDPSVVPDVRAGFRHPPGSIRREGGLERAVNATAVLNPGHAILFVIDSDDDCPASLGPALANRVKAVRPDLPVSVVLAHREYEAWFLASAESIAGKRGLLQILAAPPDVEGIRDAKGWLSQRLAKGGRYSPTQDQAALSELLNIELAFTRSRSFRKLYREVEAILKTCAIQDPGS